MQFIDNQQSLNEICLKLSKEEIIAIDSEFERRTTYFACPSIIQIASRNYKVIIDLLTTLNFDPLKQILLNEQILKIFHSPREDFEIFYHLLKILPKNFFDTQIAAKLCGMGASISYSELCKRICNIEIDKKYQKANWLKRPVKPEMLEYAINDSLYLEPIYKFLKKIIDENDLNSILDAQMNNLGDVKNYQMNLKDIWKKVSFNNKSAGFINRMQKVAAFREECASSVNVPRRHFLSDDELVKICELLPTSEQSLMRLKLNNSYLANQKYKNKLFDLCAGLKESI